jgi:hypothetical protein
MGFIWLAAGEEQFMTIGPISSISAGSLSQNVLESGNSNQLQHTLKALQNNLASGDLNGAQSSFQTLQTLFQNSATFSGGSWSSSSQLSTDMVVLGNALSSGDLSTAQSAFATVLGELKNTALPSHVNEAFSSSQSMQLVQELLNTADSGTTSSSSADLTNSVLQSVYSNQGSLNVYA